MSAVDMTFDEQVKDFIEDHEGMSFIAKQARTLYEDKDFERLKRFMSDVSGAESAQHFYDNDILGERDVF